MPSQPGDGLEGRTTKTYGLYEDYEVCTLTVKLREGKCRAPGEPGEDIVYSPNKYRETEGIKEIKQRESSVSLCQRNGIVSTRFPL